jgi:hypothetical protein
MADSADDVLELDKELIEGSADEQDQDAGQTGGDDEGEDGQPFATFGDEAAPASESESSVIRELRRANRDAQRRIAELERSAQPKPIEIGEKPSLASCEYDEERFETELDDWKATVAAKKRQEAEASTRNETQAAQWTKRLEAYEADKSTVPVADYGDKEKDVFGALSSETQALLLMTDRPAALVYALSQSPDRLAKLSELNLAEAALMIGELKGKLQMGTRKPPAPDRDVRGNRSLAGGADKELARLEKEAERTGDRTNLIAYRKTLKS